MTSKHITSDAQHIIGLHLLKHLPIHIRAKTVYSEGCVCACTPGQTAEHKNTRTQGQTLPPAAGRPLSMVLQGRRPRSPPAGPAALPVAGFSCFLPIRDTSGYKPRSFRSSLCFYGQRQVELLRGT